MENLDKLVYQKNNSGAYMTNGGCFVRFGKAGSPDFYIFFKGGKTLFLEVKRPRGKLSPKQQEFKLKTAKLGHIYEIVYSLDEAINLIKKLC